MARLRTNIAYNIAANAIGEGEGSPGSFNLSDKITISIAQREECVTRASANASCAFDINLLIPARPRITLIRYIIR